MALDISVIVYVRERASLVKTVVTDRVLDRLKLYVQWSSPWGRGFLAVKHFVRVLFWGECVLHKECGEIEGRPVCQKACSCALVRIW